ncbi:hypothetical protein HYFRA_00008239 [Hymenoscyphus fraxineus]|uniref:Uncharacterized protein n=1 Tax=Hymenoscyphus fraxineus TaxID=746836 RepID=A0A9N9L7H9_9HELO|nr:hypothetical protein HYFRA_00008239 [Hymenoscyphus fraxineus]
MQTLTFLYQLLHKKQIHNLSGILSSSNQEIIDTRDLGEIERLLEDALRLSDTGGLPAEKKKVEQIKEEFDGLEGAMIGLVQKLRSLTDYVKKDLLGGQ